MLRNTKLVSVAFCLPLFAGILMAGEWDQGPVVLGMDNWVDEGSVAIGTGPWSGVTINESEPNNAWSEADPMGSADDYSGAVSTGSEADYAAVYAEAGQGLVFETVSGGTLSDTTLTLYDTTGLSELDFDDDGGDGLLSRIEFFLPAAGTYFIKVAGYSSSYTGTYRLSVRVMGAPQPIDGWAYIWTALDTMAPRVFRPNDGSVAVLGSSDSTATINDAGAAYHHVVAAAAEGSPVLTGAVGYYNGSASIGAFFNDLALGNVTPAIIALPGSNTNNSLDTAEGMMLANHANKIADFIASGGGLISHGDQSGGNVAYGWLSLAFPGAETGLSACTPLISDEGHFSLPELQQASISTGAYGFFRDHNMSVFASAAGVSVPGPWTGVTVNETEPNNTSAQANSMQIGDDYAGDISVGGDDDRVAFDVIAGQKIVAQTIAAGLSDTTLTLYDRNGTTQLAYDDDGGPGLYSLIVYTFTITGTYYLSVEAYSSSYTGTHLMELREMLPPETLDVVIGRIPGPWLWLGNGLRGAAGVPYLSGTGELSPASPYTLNLSRAKASSPAFLILGFWRQDRSFRGGVMVPNPLNILPLATNGSGTISISGTLSPSVPASATLFAQYWIQDSSGVEGFSASNGVSMTTQ
ncbi:MAG: PPC domain-containing protein [Planctomycetota bacterium]